MDQVTAIHVSNYFTNTAIDRKHPFTIMQALKLTYISQGFHLSLEKGNPFFQDVIYAWKHGPVIESLYIYLKNQIGSANAYLIKVKSPDHLSLFKDRQMQILDVVFSKYGLLSAWDLSELTHKEGTPWTIAYNNSPNSIIQQDLIKEHFEEIITPLSFTILASQE